MPGTATWGSPLGLAYLADGRFEGYWEAHINSWDVLAGMLMVQEAGGRTNDFLANNGLVDGNEMRAATSSLWDFLSGAVRSQSKQPRGSRRQVLHH